MRTRIRLYVFLIISVIVQLIFKNYTAWMPDLILLIVVFSGIFLKGTEVLFFSFIAGILRGSFSGSTFYLDIFLFPGIGGVALVLRNLFYRNNPIVQAFITAVALCVVVVGHTIYLNVGNPRVINLLSVWGTIWRTGIMTIGLSPLIFFFLKKQTRIEE